MSILDGRIRDYLDHLRDSTGEHFEVTFELTDALRAVLDEHRPGTHTDSNGDQYTVCAECGSLILPGPNAGVWADAAYPCRTVRSLAAGLGIDLEEVAHDG